MIPDNKKREWNWYDKVLVIRTDDMERMREFLEGFGLQFKKEKHGAGPEHYAAECKGKVFEIYPTK